MNKETYGQIINIVKIIKNKGISFQDALTLIKNNLELLNIPKEELEHRLFIVMNNTVIYAVLYVEENNYAWSIYQENSFGPFIKNRDKNNHNYIIEMMLEAVEKFNRKKQNSLNKNLEEQIKEFNQINQNEEGYHLK